MVRVLESCWEQVLRAGAQGLLCPRLAQTRAATLVCATEKRSPKGNVKGKENGKRKGKGDVGGEIVGSDN